MLSKQMRSLGYKAEQKAQTDGDQAHDPQLLRFHLQKLRQPFAHGFRESKIRQPLEDENNANQGKQKFHRVLSYQVIDPISTMFQGDNPSMDGSQKKQTTPVGVECISSYFFFADSQQNLDA
jgi:hypothetical protein